MNCHEAITKINVTHISKPLKFSWVHLFWFLALEFLSVQVLSTFNMCSKLLTNFEMCNTTLLTIGIILYSRSLKLWHFA